MFSCEEFSWPACPALRREGPCAPNSQWLRGYKRHLTGPDSIEGAQRRPVNEHGIGVFTGEIGSGKSTKPALPKVSKILSSLSSVLEHISKDQSRYASER